MRIKVIIILIVAILSSGGVKVFGQNQYKIDSLLAANQIETNKEKQVNNYNTLAGLYSNIRLDSAIFYAEKALTLAEQTNYKKGMADAHFQLSYYKDRDGEANQAIIHMEKACDLYVANGDSAHLVGCYNNLGVYYSYGTELKKSQEYFIKALYLADELNETYALSEAYFNVGTFYEYLSENGLALKYYLKSLEIDTTQNEMEDISLSYINLGNINMQLHRLDDAYNYLVKAKNMISEMKDQYSSILLDLNFAHYYIETGQPDQAETHINKAKETYHKHEFARLEADIISIEADYLLAKKQYSQSIRQYDNAIKIYKQQNTSDGLYDIYTSKARAYEQLGNINKAYEALQLANQVNEETKPNEIAMVLGEFEQNEATKEKLKQYRLEQELTEQKRETEVLRMQSKFHRALFIAISLVILIAFIIYMYVINRKNNRLLESNLKTINRQKLLLEEQNKKLEKSKKELADLNATKDKFFSILAHDLKNPFHTLMGLSEIIISDKEVRHSDQFDEFIEGIFHTASSGYNLLENLLEWARSQTGNSNHHPEPVSIGEIINTNINLFHEILKDKKIEIIPPDSMNYTVYADANMVNFILRNLLNNAIKFSYPESKIEITVQQKNDSYVVHVQDYGIGMDDETVNKLFKIDQAVQKNGTAGETGTGLGLILCKEFVNKNNGKFWVESTKGKGSRFSFSLPLYKQ